MDVIRFEDPSYLIYKWQPKKSGSKADNVANHIRFGSSLRVSTGTVAAFVYKKDDGSMIDYIEGPFDEILKTKNLPIISSIIGLAYDGGTPFQAEVYFINLLQLNQLSFGIPYFDVYDSKHQEFAVPVAVRGTLSFKITEYQSFIQLNGLNNLTIEDFKKQIKSALTRYIKDVVLNIPSNENIPVVHIEKKISLVNEIVEKAVKERFLREFGVTVSSLDIDAIEYDKDSKDYLKLLKITKNISSRRIKANSTIDIAGDSVGVLGKIGNVITDVVSKFKKKNG